MPIEVIDRFEKIWKPNPGPQETFLSLPDSIFEGFYGGTVGSGKSEALLLYPIVKQYYKVPGFNGIVFRRTYPQLERTLIPRSWELYPALGFKYNDSKHVWTHQEYGTHIRFAFLNRDEDAFEHDTAEYHYVGWDELTHFTEFQYLYILHRIRAGKPGLPRISRAASIPGNIGHLWVRKRFVEPCPSGGKVIVVTKPDSDEVVSKRIFIKAMPDDNPHLLENSPNYLNQLHNLPEAERKAKLEGDWWTFSGQVFTEFRHYRYPTEPENAVHVVKPFKIPDWWPKVMSIDWGFTHKTSIHIGAIAPDARVFVHEELIRQKVRISEWGAETGQLYLVTPGIVDVVIDPSAEQDRGLEKTIKQQFMESSGIYHVRNADNDRIGGKLLVHEFLRWWPRPPKYIPKGGYDEEVAMRILRMQGDKAHSEYIKMFMPEAPETNLPRLQIFDTCTELINTIPLCVYDSKGETITEDVKKFDGDDPYDDIRYMLKAIDSYLNESIKAHEKVQELASINNQLAETGDMTSFQMGMAKLNSNKILSFRSHRRRGFYANRGIRA